MTLRDKINNAVDEAGNCRRLSYKALDLLEELFNAELKSVAGACKSRDAFKRSCSIRREQTLKLRLNYSPRLRLPRNMVLVVPVS